MKFRDLKLLALALTILVAISALFLPVVLLLAVVDPNGTEIQALSPAVAGIAAAIIITIYLARLATLICFGIWIYRAGKNLVTVGYRDLQFSPGSRIWWFFVPIAALFKPFQGMRELWNVSHGNADYDAGNSLLTAWWTFWLLNQLAGLYVSLLANANTQAAMPGVVIVGTISLGLAVTAILVVRRISAAQARLSTSATAEVFA